MNHRGRSFAAGRPGAEAALRSRVLNTFQALPIMPVVEHVARGNCREIRADYSEREAK